MTEIFTKAEQDELWSRLLNSHRIKIRGLFEQSRGPEGEMLGRFLAQLFGTRNITATEWPEELEFVDLDALKSLQNEFAQKYINAKIELSRAQQNEHELAHILQAIDAVLPRPELPATLIGGPSRPGPTFTEVFGIVPDPSFTPV